MPEVSTSGMFRIENKNGAFERHGILKTYN